MDSINVRMRVGIAGTGLGVLGNPAAEFAVDQAYGPFITGPDYQMAAPALGFSIAANSFTTLSMVDGDLLDLAGHPIVGAEAFDDVRGLMIVHSEDSEANRLMVKFGPGNNFRGPFMPVDENDNIVTDVGVACYLVPGDGIEVFSTVVPWNIAANPTDVTATTEPTSGRLPVDGTQIYLRNFDTEHAATFFLNLVGRKVGSP